MGSDQNNGGTVDAFPHLEAVLEIRFVTGEDWAFLPGLLVTQIKERYPKSEKLPIAEMPEELLRNDPALTYAPRIRFIGEGFVIQFGPRVVSLLTRGEYPGWPRIREELAWLLERIKLAGFIHEGERLGMRYIDFFEGDIFSQLVLDIRSDGQPISGVEMNFATVFRRGDLTARLVLNNGAMVTRENQVVPGSILDLDVWLEASGFDVFGDAAERFEEAHRCNKEIFFGLLKTDFLDSLVPEFD
ncbi:MAG: TIGR04255 family protein [Verrucomicrobia bacterium]|nr:TIGR04255 family protein [Verrucomicrobiota bacterium]